MIERRTNNDPSERRSSMSLATPHPAYPRRWLAAAVMIVASTVDLIDGTIVYGATLGFASAIGLILGGVLTQANLFGWGWRSVFLVNIPIVVASLIAAAIVVPETRARSHRRPDLAGAAILTAALVAIVFPIL